MIKARHHRLYEWFFDNWISLVMGINFSGVRVYNKWDDNGRPVLLVANHFGWWDGFLQRRLSHNLFRRRFHVMALEEELAKRKFLSRLGAFSIKKNSRSLLETMAYTRELLKDPGNMVLIFPQGELQSMHQRPIRFENGWFTLVEKSADTLQVVLMVTLTDYGSKPRPTISHYIDGFDRSSGISASRIEDSFNEFFERCIQQQVNLS